VIELGGLRLAVPVLVCSQVNVVKDGRGVSYAFRESAVLEHKAHNVLILEVSWAEDHRGFKVIESAEFRVRIPDHRER
jgi:hypothetical protein